MVSNNHYRGIFHEGKSSEKFKSVTFFGVHVTVSGWSICLMLTQDARDWGWFPSKTLNPLWHKWPIWSPSEKFKAWWHTFSLVRVNIQVSWWSSRIMLTWNVRGCGSILHWGTNSVNFGPFLTCNIYVTFCDIYVLHGSEPKAIYCQIITEQVGLKSTRINFCTKTFTSQCNFP